MVAVAIITPHRKDDSWRQVAVRALEGTWARRVGGICTDEGDGGDHAGHGVLAGDGVNVLLDLVLGHGHRPGVEFPALFQGVGFHDDGAMNSGRL